MEQPIRGFFAMFNRYFDKSAHGYGWLSGKLVRFAVLMLLVYAGIIAFGLNEFRKTPRASSRSIDRGYLIIVTQLPPGASLGRTDEVMRRGDEIALSTPGVAHRSEHRRLFGRDLHQCAECWRDLCDARPVRETRGRPEAVGRRHPGPAVRETGVDPRSLLRRAPPPVPGIGNAGGFRMMIEDRGGRGRRRCKARSSR